MEADYVNQVTTETNTNQISQDLELNKNIPEAYSPKGYWWYGLLLGPIPIFYMSFFNSKVLPNGPKFRSLMKIFLLIYIIFFIAYNTVLAWSTQTLTREMSSYLLEHPGMAISFEIDPTSINIEDIIKSSPTMKQAYTFTDNAGTIYFFANALLMIITILITRKLELNDYNELKSLGKIRYKSERKPLFLGLISIVLLSILSSVFVKVIGKLFFN